ncbi:glycosyltransferase [Chitinophaga sp. Cy-1792]|uniref:glycosyltransferase n=1 Tax=Chitinophaga sp. Cy-1792 TaxID=2608339 RepID=UPI001422E855|nr:glycosyltransferase [Chitinophaga sp. Cy-1792]NIG55490.1 glycosyltransferase family 4 protein [Chitinophaga sp. Cy-1792]
MRILFAGKYDPSYNRTRILLDGLASLPGVTVEEYCFRKRSRWNIPALKRACNRADVIFLPSFTHTDVPWVRFFTKKPIIFDPLISRYQSKVFDYKVIRPGSIRARKNFLKDSLALKYADLVICDTQAHGDYFQRTFDIAAEKLRVIQVGVDINNFYPAAADKSDLFTVGFYGSFIPLQGVRQILAAATLLKDHTDIRFQLIGNGFEYKEMLSYAATHQLSNVSFLGWMPYDALNNAVNRFDMTLGIFGSGEKTAMVIPNKIYHYAALRKPVLTCDTPAIKEVFTHNSNILLCSHHAADIAAGILILKNNPSLREQIAGNGYKLITTGYNASKMAGLLLEAATTLLNRGR